MIDMLPIDTRVTHDVVCVLYAEGSGQIEFVHRVTTLGDARPQPDADIEADARSIMQTTRDLREGHPPADLRALIISPDAFQRGRSYVVDVKTSRLIEGDAAGSR
jgi:hypothetical protein